MPALWLPALERPLRTIGIAVIAFAILALGVEAIVCAKMANSAELAVTQMVPLGVTLLFMRYVGGLVLIACGAGILIPSLRSRSAVALGLLLTMCAIVTQIPQYVAHPGDMGYRTTVFEPLSIAMFLLLLPAYPVLTTHLEPVIRWVLAVGMIVFGVDHFIGLDYISHLIPGWIPWREFWTAFFGVGMIAAGISMATRILERLSAVCLGAMFAIWVITLHIPHATGVYRISGRPPGPNGWSSLFIAIALWGGSWALAGRPEGRDARLS